MSRSSQLSSNYLYNGPRFTWNTNSTLAYWAKCSNWGGGTLYTALMGHRNGSTGWLIEHRSGDLTKLGFIGGTVCQYEGHTLLSTTNWVHLVFRKTGTTMDYFINGAKQGSGVTIVTLNNDTVSIGLSIFGYWVDGAQYTSEAFRGSIAELAWWESTALTDAQISSASGLYTGSQAGKAANNIGVAPTHYWKGTQAEGDGALIATVGGDDLTEAGTVAADSDHPTIDYGGSSVLIRGVKGMAGGMQNLSGGTQ